MTKQNDVSTLFSGIGIDSGSYKELASERQLDESLCKWSLLATVHKTRTGHQPKPLVSQAVEKPLNVPMSAPESVQEPVVDTAPVISLFQRISSPPVSTARAEPTISTLVWEQPEDRVAKSAQTGVQSLFARLARADAVTPERNPSSASSNLFQRLLKQ